MNTSWGLIGLVCLLVLLQSWALIKVYRKGFQIGRSKEEREWVIHWMIDGADARVEKFFQAEKAERKKKAERVHS